MNILKTTELYTLKQVNYMVCELYLTKLFLKRKEVKKLTNIEKEIPKLFISILLEKHSEVFPYSDSPLYTE